MSRLAEAQAELAALESEIALLRQRIADAHQELRSLATDESGLLQSWDVDGLAGVVARADALSRLINAGQSRLNTLQNHKLDQARRTVGNLFRAHQANLAEIDRLRREAQSALFDQKIGQAQGALETLVAKLGNRDDYESQRKLDQARGRVQSFKNRRQQKRDEIERLRAENEAIGVTT